MSRRDREWVGCLVGTALLLVLLVVIVMWTVPQILDGAGA